MSEELEVLKNVTGKLNELNMPYMVSGSIAANYYTVPRMTRDIDIIIELGNYGVQKITDSFRNDFIIDKSLIEEEIKDNGMFNIIHNKCYVKIAFILRKNDEFRRTEFGRKNRVMIDGCPIWMVSKEDLVIAKLSWAKDSLSDMQLKDISNILKTSKEIDMKYIENWINKLNLKDVYNRISL